MFFFARFIAVRTERHSSSIQVGTRMLFAKSEVSPEAFFFPRYDVNFQTARIPCVPDQFVEPAQRVFRGSLCEVVAFAGRSDLPQAWIDCKMGHEVVCFLFGQRTKEAPSLRA